VNDGSNALMHVLIALAAVVIAGRLLGRAFRYLGQPPVIGEVVGGIVLGPSLLGRVWPQATAFILPASVAPFLAVIARLGIILYMFLVGLELNAGILHRRAQATLVISSASILLPFLLGVALALVLYPRLSSTEVRFSSFALFGRSGPGMRGCQRRRGLVSARSGGRHRPGETGRRLAGRRLSAAYLGFLLLLVRPLARRFAARQEKQGLNHGALAIVLAALLLSALATEAIGIHAIFGAFLLGAVVPHDSAIARTLTSKLEDLVTVLFLPAFFAYTGMRTRIGLIGGIEQWLLCGLIVLVATAGKFGGTLVSARLTGLGWREATALGLLMNTRGLMELIVLNIGLDLGVISPALFTMMVLMALVTTLAATPFLQWLRPG
jgi:Kef-type K+ transport system membrane component KefB